MDKRKKQSSRTDDTSSADNASAVECVNHVKDSQTREPVAIELSENPSFVLEGSRAFMPVPSDLAAEVDSGVALLEQHIASEARLWKSAMDSLNHINSANRNSRNNTTKLDREREEFVKLAKEGVREYRKRPLKLAVFGATGAGKSFLINHMLNAGRFDQKAISFSPSTASDSSETRAVLAFSHKDEPSNWEVKVVSLHDSYEKRVNLPPLSNGEDAIKIQETVKSFMKTYAVGKPSACKRIEVTYNFPFLKEHNITLYDLPGYPDNSELLNRGNQMMVKHASSSFNIPQPSAPDGDVAFGKSVKMHIVNFLKETVVDIFLFVVPSWRLDSIQPEQYRAFLDVSAESISCRNETRAPLLVLTRNPKTKPDSTEPIGPDHQLTEKVRSKLLNLQNAALEQDSTDADIQASLGNDIAVRAVLWTFFPGYAADPPCELSGLTRIFQDERYALAKESLAISEEQFLQARCKGLDRLCVLAINICGFDNSKLKAKEKLDEYRREIKGVFETTRVEAMSIIRKDFNGIWNTLKNAFKALPESLQKDILERQSVDILRQNDPPTLSWFHPLALTPTQGQTSFIDQPHIGFCPDEGDNTMQTSITDWQGAYEKAAEAFCMKLQEQLTKLERDYLISARKVSEKLGDLLRAVLTKERMQDLARSATVDVFACKGITATINAMRGFVTNVTGEVKLPDTLSTAVAAWRAGNQWNHAFPKACEDLLANFPSLYTAGNVPVDFNEPAGSAQPITNASDNANAKSARFPTAVMPSLPEKKPSGEERAASLAGPNLHKASSNRARAPKRRADEVVATDQSNSMAAPMVPSKPTTTSITEFIDACLKYKDWSQELHTEASTKNRAADKDSNKQTLVLPSPALFVSSNRKATAYVLPAIEKIELNATGVACENGGVYLPKDDWVVGNDAFADFLQKGTQLSQLRITLMNGLLKECQHQTVAEENTRACLDQGIRKGEVIFIDLAVDDSKLVRADYNAPIIIKRLCDIVAEACNVNYDRLAQSQNVSLFPIFIPSRPRDEKYRKPKPNLLVDTITSMPCTPFVDALVFPIISADDYHRYKKMVP